MDGCIYRTKDGECDLYTEGGKYKAFCDMDGCKGRKMSNGDRIRSMTNKELAKFLCDIVSISDGCYDCVAGKCCEEPFDGSDNGFEQWLMQERAE